MSTSSKKVADVYDDNEEFRIFIKLQLMNRITQIRDLSLGTNFEDLEDWQADSLKNYYNQEISRCLQQLLEIS
jgi:hypothetical protein